jgi:thiol:disulfide interchange protein DsbD
LRASALVAALAFGGVGQTLAEPVDTGHIEVELAPQTAGAAPGSTLYVAIRHEIDDGWHTYWRNSGDSGAPPTIDWTLPPGWSAGEIVWPAPELQAEAHLMTYGYSGEVYLPVPIQVPASARVGDTVRLQAHAQFLVCADICIPEDARVAVDVPVVDGTPRPHPAFGRAVTRTLERAPKPAGLTGAVSFENGVLKVAAVGGPLADADPAGAYFFPYDGSLIEHAAEQKVERGPEGVTFTLTPATALSMTGLKGPVTGVVATRDGAWEVSLPVASLPEAAAGLGFVASASGLGPTAGGSGGGAGSGALALLGWAGGAFLGGLLLNLMPCVFPVLAMKGAALARGAHQPTEARRDGLLFLAGVLTTFLALAGVLIALQAAGQAVGWGFQLQSSAVTAGLTLLMLAIALNLSGVFRLGTSVQGVGADLSARRGAAGAFFTGVLAVVVAAPCTAPFMAGAIGWALTQSAPAALLVFAALGLGLALPFVLLSFSPAALRRLPEPGPWMERLRNLLAFPMYGAAAWMAWVFAQQSGDLGLAFLFAAAVLLALGLWLWGEAQSAERRPVIRLSGAVAALLLAVALVGFGAATDRGQALAAASGPAQLDAEAWTPERVAALRAEGRPVFVNFTAAWCVTCKVNEVGALQTRAVKAAFDRSGVVYMKGDWTRRDAAIAKELAAHGRSGVPLYLLYRPGEDRPVVLPQLLTEGAVVQALEGARSA